MNRPTVDKTWWDIETLTKVAEDNGVEAVIWCSSVTCLEGLNKIYMRLQSVEVVKKCMRLCGGTCYEMVHVRVRSCKSKLCEPEG
jgi:hypothetical protein